MCVCVHICMCFHIFQKFLCHHLWLSLVRKKKAFDILPPEWLPREGINSQDKCVHHLQNNYECLFYTNITAVVVVGINLKVANDASGSINPHYYISLNGVSTSKVALTKMVCLFIPHIKCKCVLNQLDADLCAVTYTPDSSSPNKCLGNKYIGNSPNYILGQVINNIQPD